MTDRRYDVASRGEYMAYEDWNRARLEVWIGDEHADNELAKEKDNVVC